MSPADATSASSSFLVRHRDRLVLAVFIAAGLLKGFQNATAGRPDWCYWEALATQPWMEVVGPDKALFGYLPGFAPLIYPFIALPHQLGLLAFLAINAACCWGIGSVLKRSRHEPERPLPTALVVMLAIPMYFSLQNNQVVAPAALLALCGATWITRGSSWGALALGFAALIKTLPIVLLCPLVLLGHWRMALLAGLALASLSLGLFALTEGISTSLEAHLRVPEQLGAQNPNRILTGGEVPSSYSDNMSLSAAMIGLRGILGDSLTHFVNLGWFAGTLLLTIFATLRGRGRKLPPMAWLGLWLSWTVLAAPFGRYYYLLILTPAWTWLWPTADRSKRRRYTWLVCWLIALAPLTARSSGFYAPITLITYAACVAKALAWPVSTGSEQHRN